MTSSLEDCGQDGVCAIAPGCIKHWEERNRELVRERDLAEAKIEAALDLLHGEGHGDCDRCLACQVEGVLSERVSP